MRTALERRYIRVFTVAFQVWSILNQPATYRADRPVSVFLLQLSAALMWGDGALVQSGVAQTAEHVMVVVVKVMDSHGEKG